MLAQSRLMNITRESNDASDTQIILSRREVFGFIADAEHFDILVAFTRVADPAGW